MAAAESRQPPRGVEWWPVALVMVVCLSIAMRAKINFATELPTGVDAAYYPLQARALLEQGRLAYFDLPLVFAVDATDISKRIWP